MSSVLHSIISETDGSKLSTLYKQLFSELKAMDNTLQEDDFLDKNMDELLQILIRDTDITVNTNITSNTLYHIMPVIGFVLNLCDTLLSKNNNYDQYLKKLHFNPLNIIRDTTDLELCIHCLFMFKSILFKPHKKMESFLPLFYESTYQFLFDDINRFIPQSNPKRIGVLRKYILECYINLFFNNNKYELLLSKSPNWLHIVTMYLISDHYELQQITIKFLIKFINHIKTLDPYNSVQYQMYKKYLTENNRLFKNLEIIIKEDTNNKINPNKNTIYKFQEDEYNDTLIKQIRNLKIWSICIHLINSNMRSDQILINRLLKYFQPYLRSNTVDAYKYFNHLIFVFNLKTHHIEDKKGLTLFYKVFKHCFDETKGEKTLMAKIECIKTWCYAIALLSKHKVLFKEKKDKKHIAYKIIVAPLLELINLPNLEDVIVKNIIFMMIYLLRINDEDKEDDIDNNGDNGDREMSPNDIDMKEMDILQSVNGNNHNNNNNKNGELLPNAMDIDINNLENENDIIEIDRNIKEYKWKFSDWSVAMDSIIAFIGNINKRFIGNDLCIKLMTVFLETFFKSIHIGKGLQNQQIQKKILQQHLEKITLCLVSNCYFFCNKDKLKNNKYLYWKRINNISVLFEIYLKNIKKYQTNLEKLKIKQFYNNTFGIKLDEYNKNIIIYLMKLWLNKCESFELFPFTNIYEQFIKVYNINNNVIDTVHCLEIYHDLIKKMLSKLSKMSEIKENNDNNDNNDDDDESEKRLNDKLVLRNLCCVLSHIFYEIFNNLLQNDGIKQLLNRDNMNDDEDEQEIYDKIMLISQNVIESLFKFITIFDLKFNKNNKGIFKMEWFEENDKNQILKRFKMIIPSIYDIFCKILNGKYNEKHGEYVENVNISYLSKPNLNHFITNIHHLLSDKHHELLLMKWCKYKEYELFLHEISCLMLIKFGQLLLQCLYKSDQNWYHQIDNKQLFQFITSIFLYIIHRCNNIKSVSIEWIKHCKYFIKSFNKFLSKLSMTEYVNIWSHSISNRLLWYIKHQCLVPTLSSMESFESDKNNNNNSNNNNNIETQQQSLYDSISQCFITYIHISCNYSSIHLIDKILHKTPSKKEKKDNLQIQFIELLHFIMKLNENNNNNNKEIWKILNNAIQLKMKNIFKFINKSLKIKFDSNKMQQKYPLFVKLYNKYKQKENDILTQKKNEKEKEKEREKTKSKSPDIDKQKERDRLLFGDSNCNDIKPIKIKKQHKTSMVTTRSRRRSRKKREYVDLDDSQHPMLTFSETQMSFDIFDDQMDNDNNNDINIDDNKHNKNNKKNDNHNDNDIDIDIDMKEMEKTKSKSISAFDAAQFPLNPSDIGLQQEFDILESSDKSKSKSKSISLDIDKINNNNNDNDNDNDKNENGSSMPINLASTIRSNDDIKISGKKRKLDEIGEDLEKIPKSKRMKLDENELFFPLLIGYDAKIDNLLNMLPRKIRILIQKLPFNTIDDLAKCEYNVVIKYLIEEKTKNTKSNVVEFEVNEIKKTLQRLVIIYDKEKKKKKQKKKKKIQKIIEPQLTEMSTTDNDNDNDNNNDNNQYIKKQRHRLDAKSEEIELKITKAFVEFEQHKNEWNLTQIARIHQIIGKFNNYCIQSTANELNKKKTS